MMQDLPEASGLQELENLQGRKNGSIRMPLKVKTALFVIVPIILVGISLTIVFWLSQKKVMVRDFERTGDSLASVLAKISRFGVMQGNVKELQGLAEGVTGDESFTSVMILNDKGRVLADDGGDEVPEHVVREVVEKLDPPAIYYRSEANGERRIAIAVPILGSGELTQVQDLPKASPGPAAVPLPEAPPAPVAPEAPSADVPAPPLPGSDAPGLPAEAPAMVAPKVPELNDERRLRDARTGTVIVSVNMELILQRSTGTLLTGILVSGVVTFVAAGVSWLLATLTLRPLEQVGVMLREIAKGEADLTQRINVTSSDEIGDLAKWFNEFIESIQNIIRLVAGTANRVVNTAEELGATSEEVTAGAQEISSAVHAIARGVINQQDRVRETSLIMEEMSRALHNVAIGSQNAAEISNQTREIASSNRYDIDSANQVLLEVSDFIRTSGESISSLNESSKKIGAAADVIRGVARTTNLLSLNASIEAARASEEGKGFGVVAEEIGNLARQSAVATDEIDSMIRALRRDVEGVVEEMESGERQIRNVGDVSGRAGKALERIMEAVEEVAVTVQQISTSIQKQVEGTEKLVTALDAIASVAEDVSASTEEVSAAADQQNQSMDRMSASAQDLSMMADDLQKLVHRFRI